MAGSGIVEEMPEQYDTAAVGLMEGGAQEEGIMESIDQDIEEKGIEEKGIEDGFENEMVEEKGSEDEMMEEGLSRLETSFHELLFKIPDSKDKH